MERNINVLVPGACPKQTVEQIVDVLVPLSILKEIVAVVTLVPHERVRQRTVEQIVHVAVPTVVEETAELVQTIPRSASRSVSPTESSMCQVLKQHQALPIQTEQNTCEVPQVQPWMNGRRSCCDADPAGAEDSRVTSASVQRQSGGFQLCNRKQMPHSSEAAVHRQGLQHSHRGAVTNPSPESSEGDRYSTGSVPVKMVDVTVVPGHRCTSLKGRPRSQLQKYSKTMRFLSADAQSRDE